MMTELARAGAHDSERDDMASVAQHKRTDATMI